MLRHVFEQKQRRLQDAVLVLGGHVEDALRHSVEAVRQKNVDAARNLIANSRNISRKCAAIEADTLALLATQQPMAGDLRILATTLEVALELERIGSHAREIAGVNLKQSNLNLFDSFAEIDDMAKLAENMLHRALEAFARQDVELARAVPCQDDRVDDLYRQIHRHILAQIKAHPGAVAQAIYLSHVGHHLERVGDRATNICEWVVFAITGAMKELNGQANLNPVDERIKT